LGKVMAFQIASWPSPDLFGGSPGHLIKSRGVPMARTKPAPEKAGAEP
jgi:hypothetical protein